MLDDEPDLPLGQALQAAAQHFRAALAAALAARGVPDLGAAMDLLPLLPAAGLPQSRLTALAGLSKQAVQQSLDILETGGLVRRLVDPADRRLRQVFITEAGSAALMARRAAEHDLERAFREAVGRRRKARLQRGLQRLVRTPLALPPEGNADN
jgi:DNA-binding MarR family transcriptional regulator